MNASTLRRMQVISMVDGEVIGTIADLLFETEHPRAVGILLAGENRRSILPFDAILSVGRDTVTIVSTSRPSPTEPAMRGAKVCTLSDLTELPVANDSGAYVGDLKELEIDPIDGRLTKLLVHRPGRFGVGGTSLSIEATAVRSMGPKLVTVDLPTSGGKSG